MIDKPMNAHEMGEDPQQEAAEVEIPTDNPAIVIELDDGGVEVQLGEEEPAPPAFYANLAEHMDETALHTLATDLINEIEEDLQTRSDWEKTAKEGIELLGLKYEELSEPWDNACGAFHPMITEAVVRFQAETVMETFPATGPVLAKIVGDETPDRKKAAQRVQAEMNYQLTEVMQEYRPEHEKLLWGLPCTGSAFKKVYEDPLLGRACSRYVPAEDVILPYGFTDMQTAERLTHRMKKSKVWLERAMADGTYRKVDVDSQPLQEHDELQQAKDKEVGVNDLNSGLYTVYEVLTYQRLPGFETDSDKELSCPYVVTILKDNNTVLSIRRNWIEGDPLQKPRQHFVHYVYIPGFGPYGFGLFHLIGGFARSATSIMRQLVDAGTLANLPGGLKTKGLRIKNENSPISPGEFRDVDVAGGKISDNVMPLPYKEPSATLYQLLNTIVEEGRRFAATGDIQISDMSANTPVGTTLAVLERQLKTMSAVQARVHFALKEELRLVAEILKGKLPPGPPTDPYRAVAEDFGMVDIIPVSDPNAATMSQRVIQFQAAHQMAQTAPQIYNLPELHREMLETMGFRNAAKIVKIPEDMKPRDPVSENIGLMTMQPAKAFIHQDHQAHITAHLSLMQDPSVAQVIGQNPNAQAMMAGIHAHVAEHVGFLYRARLEQQIGVALPAPDAELPAELEIQLSRMVAQATPAIVQQAQIQANMQQAQQQAQDPVVQLQSRELDIREEEVRRKAAKDSADIAIKSKLADIKEAEVQMADESAMTNRLIDMFMERNSKKDLQ